ncbi:beta strand repeat-containing protein, partial [Listeria booriae]|uniref:beta strand repeat-containing protein n=1 Tax=Listeria booriae TaxID=1552123 RepID=UPI001624DAF4
MINKKRVNKVTKLTVASAIAFSALAQPLGTVVTVKAAEAPTSKAESRLLTASRDAQFKNAQFTSTATSIPEWTPIGFTIRIGYTIQNFSTLNWTKSGSWFKAGNDTSIMPDGVGGFQIQTTDGGNSGGMEQIIDTVPGEKYTISFKSRLVQMQGNSGVPFVRLLVGDGLDTSNARKVILNNGLPLDSYTATFTATSTKTAIDIGIGNGRVGYPGWTGIYNYSDFSITNASTTNIAAPTINSITDKDTVATGTGTANKHVRIELADGTILTGEVGADGKYSVTIPEQSAGTVVKAALYDGEGNVSPDASTTVVADTVAPPTIKPVTSDDTTVKGTGVNGATVTLTIGGTNYTGTVSGGEYSITIPKQSAGTVITATESLNGKTSTSVNTTVTQGSVAAPTINGVKSDDTTVKGRGIPGATVTVTIAGQERTATVNAAGDYSVTIPAQAVGTEITAKQTLNGKTSDPVSTTVTQGTVAVPTIDTVTTDDTTLKGSGINGATVTVKIGSQEYTATVGQDGKYSITIPKQAFGTAITAKQTLNGQTSSEANKTVTQGAVTAPAIDAVTTDDETVKGTGIVGATVTVKVGSQEYTATVDQDGKYSITISKQAFGTEITAKQTLNGKTSSDATITVTQGTVAPPTINPVVSDDTTVKGSCLPGATVTVIIGGQEYPATVTNNEYSATIPKQASGTIISAKQTLNGKTSNLATTTVGQGTVAAPTINSLTSDDTTASGTGITGAVVTITIGSLTYNTTVVNGNYSVTIPKQAAGTVVYAKQTLFGQTSDNAQTTVTQGSIAAPTINAVTTDSTTVSGTGLNGATVTVKVGSQDYTATVANNAYSITIPKQAFGTEITAKQTLNGQTSDEANTTVTQGNVANPAINAVTSDDTNVTGSGITGATVTLTIGDQDYQGTVTNGTYTITIPKQAAGTVISGKQTLNGKTSGSVSVTVTQGTLAAPTINDFTVGDAYVSGTAPAGATKVALYVGDQFLRYAAVTDGKYRVYAADNASMGVAGTAFQVASVDAAGTIGAKASSTVKPSTTVAAPTINDFYVGDVYAKGTATGANKVTLYINGVAVRTAAVAANGTYSIYTGDRASLAIAGNTFQVEASNAAGKTSTKTTGTVKAKLAAPTINDFYAGDAYAKGTAAGGANKVTLYIDGVAVRQAAVAADGSYSIYTGDRATLATAGNTFQIESSAPTGETSAKTTGTVKAKETVAAPTINDFYVGDAYAKGTATGANKVTLYINGVAVRTAAVAANGTYSIYTGDRASLAIAGNTFQVEASNAAGKTSTKTTGTVKAKLAAPTINDFYAGDAYAKGTAAGGANKVTLYIDGVAVRQAAVAADGSYSIYTGDRATLATAGNTFQIESSAPTGETSAKTTGTVKAKETVAAPTINDFYVGDAYAKGIATGANKVTLYVNNVAIRQAAVAADGTYTIYTGDQTSLATAGNTFQIQAVKASGATSVKTTGTVKAKETVAAPTINDFYVGDAYAKG